MISVVIPYMAIEPYCFQIDNCLESLANQTAELQVIVSEHEIERYIRLNKLKKDGIKKSSGDFIWFCGADFILDDETLLYRMRAKLIEGDLDVIFPMYVSPAYGKYKVTDGSEFVRHDVVTKLPLDESHIGISKSTMVSMAWYLDNAKWYASKDFVVRLDHSLGRKLTRVHYPTEKVCKPYFKKVTDRFKQEGLWLS